MCGLSSSAGSSPTVGYYLNNYPVTAPVAALVGKVVIGPDWAYRLTGQILQGQFIQSGATQISQTAVCNRHHSIEQRICRRLLLGLDRVTTDEVTLTHDVLANVLGVWRDGVTKATRELHRSGVIHYHRGHIVVINRAGLEARCCECYGVVKRESDRLLGRSASAGLPEYRAGNLLIRGAHWGPDRVRPRMMISGRARRPEQRIAAARFVPMCLGPITPSCVTKPRAKRDAAVSDRVAERDP
jgi:hypothetical protein